VRLEIEGRETAHDTILNDSELMELVNEAVGHPNLIGFVASVISDFKSRESALAGVGTGGITLRVFAERWGKTTEERRARARIVDLFESLYQRYEPGNLRGMIVEQIVQRRMPIRYGGDNDVVENNAFFVIRNGGTFRSHPNSIDVLAFDAVEERGECHTCKVQARDFAHEANFIERLVNEVAPRGIRIGLVCAQERKPAERKLREGGIPIGVARLVTPEDWLSIPLQT
jgi:hypothetical protein